MNKKKIYLFILAFMLIFLGFSNSASAITITPVRYEIKGDPGQTVTEEMTIINEDNIDATFYSSFANFEAQGETGSATFVEPKDDIGTWISTEESITLSPGEQKTINFSIKIPENAEPGGHFGIVFWGTSPENTPDGEKLAVSAKTGLLILLSVSGDVEEKGGLLSFGTKDNQFWYNSLPVSFVYRFRNDGGDRIKPAGFIKLRNTLFIPTEELDANPVNGNILPSSTRKFTVDWVKYTKPQTDQIETSITKNFFDKVSYQWKNFAVGLYSAKLDISYGSNQNIEQKVYFFVFPWQLLVCLIIILLIIFFGGKKLISSYNKHIISKANSAIGKTEEADNV